MKPYMIIEGNSQSIDNFEQKVADALEMGYSLAGELVTHPASPNEIKFYQTVILAADDEYEDDEEEDEEDVEEDEI